VTFCEPLRQWTAISRSASGCSAESRPLAIVAKSRSAFGGNSLYEPYRLAGSQRHA
jgi:hypothetical protein